MENAGGQQEPRWDVFISHSTRDKGMATRLGQDLAELGQRVWIDYENLFVGDLLPQKIGEAIRDSSMFVLLWSSSTDSSKWVPQELQAALTAGRPIMLCLLDATPYAHHEELADRFFCDLGSSYEAGLARLVAALARRGTTAGTGVGAARAERAPAKRVNEIAAAQQEILDAMERLDFARAAARQARLDPVIEASLERWPRDPWILSCAGYHLKNAVRVAMRDAGGELAQGEAKRLDEAARLFHRALAMEPGSINALNGLASIEGTRGNLEMAEHYCLRALAQARSQGIDYVNARSDLEALRAERLRRSGQVDPATTRPLDTQTPLGASGSVAVMSFRGIAAAIPEEWRIALTDSLRAFAAHLASLGLPEVERRPLLIDIRPDAPYEAAYDEAAAAIVMKPVWIHDPSIVFREYTHHVILHAARARPDGAAPVDSALESGLADYLPCSFVGDPVMGRVGARVAFDVPWIRDLDNEESMERYGASSPPQHRGAVFGGAFWQLRELRGAEVVDPLVAEAWLAACASGADFVRAFVDAVLRGAAEREAGVVEDIRRVFTARKIQCPDARARGPGGRRTVKPRRR